MQTELLEQIKSEAINTVKGHANPEWMKEARATVSILCKIGRPFTGDDVWRLLEGRGIYTHEPRALGAIIQKFARDRLIFPTGEYRKSVRRESHRRPLAVWKPVNNRLMELHRRQNA